MSSRCNDAVDWATLEHLEYLLSRLTGHNNNLSVVIGKLEEAVDRLPKEQPESTFGRTTETKIVILRKMTVEKNSDTITYEAFNQYKSFRFIRRHEGE